MTTEVRPPNMTQLSKDLFLVRTQAGLKKALKQVLGADRGSVAVHVHSPSVYFPSIVRLQIVEWRGSEVIFPSFTHINDYLKESIEILGKISTADPHSQPFITTTLSQLIKERT